MKQLWTYPELLRSRRFWGYALCMASSSGSFYAFLGGAPLVAAAVFQMSPAMLGFAMGAMTAGFMLGSFLAGRFGVSLALTTLMRSEEHTSELQSLMRLSYAVFCLKKKKIHLAIDTTVNTYNTNYK